MGGPQQIRKLWQKDNDGDAAKPRHRAAFKPA